MGLFTSTSRTALITGFLLGYALSSVRYLGGTTRQYLCSMGSTTKATDIEANRGGGGATTAGGAVGGAAAGAVNNSNKYGFDLIVQAAQAETLRGTPLTNAVRKMEFNISAWDQEFRSNGGLLNVDRINLARIYSEAESVFEYGLGESTLIANHVGVKHYAGVDSDPMWVESTRHKVASHFRFYLADIGETGDWGYPKENLSKAVLHYQLAPLLVESKPFDVYMVDGRFRFPCLMASFLHASARMAGESDLTKTVVLMHDCRRGIYHRADHLFDVVNLGRRLCMYRRKKDTTDVELVGFWMSFYMEVD